MATSPVLVVVGNPDDNHIGAHLMHAAAQIDCAAEICDVRRAWTAPRWRARASWRLNDHRPPSLEAFSREAARLVDARRPRYVLATGLAPLDAAALERIGRSGATRLNFLTDDPWNPSHRAAWFFEALRHYDRVFTPRRANLADLQRLVGDRLEYLPFAYAPERHFPEPPLDDANREADDADVVFAGGADTERVKVIGALLAAGLRVHLYGGYWDRYRQTRAHARGFLDPAALRRAIGRARVNLCLVRRANRDGHSMRSFEIPAMGGCMVAEPTGDHRAIFGSGRDVVDFFADGTGPNGLVPTVRRLLADSARRAHLARQAHGCITRARATYADRLKTMLEAGAA